MCELLLYTRLRMEKDAYLLSLRPAWKAALGVEAEPRLLSSRQGVPREQASGVRLLSGDMAS